MNQTELLLVAALILGAPMQAAAQSPAPKETEAKLTEALEGDKFESPSSELLASPRLAEAVSKRLADFGLTDPDALTPEQVLAACPDESSQACKSIRRLLILRQSLRGSNPGPDAAAGPNAAPDAAPSSAPEAVRESLAENASRSVSMTSLNAGTELSFDGRDALSTGALPAVQVAPILRAAPRVAALRSDPPPSPEDGMVVRWEESKLRPQPNVLLGDKHVTELRKISLRPVGDGQLEFVSSEVKATRVERKENTGWIPWAREKAAGVPGLKQLGEAGSWMFNKGVGGVKSAIGEFGGFANDFKTHLEMLEKVGLRNLPYVLGMGQGGRVLSGKPSTPVVDPALVAHMNVEGLAGSMRGDFPDPKERMAEFAKKIPSMSPEELADVDAGVWMDRKAMLRSMLLTPERMGAEAYAKFLTAPVRPEERAWSLAMTRGPGTDGLFFARLAEESDSTAMGGWAMTVSAAEGLAQGVPMFGALKLLAAASKFDAASRVGTTLVTAAKVTNTGVLIQTTASGGLGVAKGFRDVSDAHQAGDLEKASLAGGQLAVDTVFTALGLKGIRDTKFGELKKEVQDAWSDWRNRTALVPHAVWPRSVDALKALGTLGLKPGATWAEIVATHRGLMWELNPELARDNPGANHRARLINDAFDVLEAANEANKAPSSHAPTAESAASTTRPTPEPAPMASDSGLPAVVGGASEPSPSSGGVGIQSLAWPSVDGSVGGNPTNAATLKAERLKKAAEAAPPQVKWANNTWDVEAVEPDGTVRIELEGSKDALYPLPLLNGSPVRFRGSEGQIASATQDSITVVLAGGREVTLSAADLAGEAGRGLTVIRGGRELAARKADSDGTVRFSPLLPPGPPTVMKVPLPVFGAVPVRLKGREQEGLFTLAFDGGRLTATPRGPANGARPVTVTPDQVAGRHVELDSPEFGTVHVDSRRAALDRAARGAQKPTPDAASVAPAFGALVGGKTVVGPGDAVLDGMVKHVGEVKGPLTTSLFELEVSDDGSAPGDRLLDALIAHAVGGPGKAPERVRIVYNNVRDLDPRVAARVAAAKKAGADIEVVVPRNVSIDVQTVNHSKTLAGGDVGYLMTGGLSAKAASKVELGVSLPPRASQKLDEYLGLLAAPGSNTARRKAAAEDLARQGVVVNDPLLSQGGYLARAVNGLLHGAEKSLEVYVKELKDADSTRTLIDKARAGVRVDVAVRNTDGIGEQSLKMVRDALTAEPGLPLTLKVYPKTGGPLPHGNLIVADGSRAYLGTAFLWTSHMSGVMPGGRAFDHGVLLEGGDAARVHRQFREAVPTPDKDVLKPAAPLGEVETRDSGLWQRLTSVLTGTPVREGRAPKDLGPEAEAAVTNLRSETRAALEAEKGRLVRYLRVLRPGADAGKAFDGLLSSADAMDIRLARPGELAAKASHVREKGTGREYVVMRTDVLGSSPEVRRAVLAHELFHGAGFGEFTTHMVEAILGGRGDAASSDPHQVDQARLHKAMRQGELGALVLKGYGVGKLAADGEPETLLRLNKESLKRARATETPADRRDALERVDEQRRAMGLRIPQDAAIVKQFERLKDRQNLTEADLVEAVDLGRRVRAAGLPTKPFVDQLFYDAVDVKALPEYGIKLRVGDAAGGDPVVRAKILDAFLAAVKTVGEPVDFKVGLFMRRMTGTQAGKFITIYTRDPVKALKLADSLEAGMADQGLLGTRPTEDFAFGRSGLVSWAAAGYKSREFSVPDGRGGWKVIRDDPARRPEVLDSMAHLPGMKPWVELAETTPQMARHREWTRGLETAGREPAPLKPTAEQFRWYEKYDAGGREDTLDADWKWAVVRYMDANPTFKP